VQAKVAGGSRGLAEWAFTVEAGGEGFVVEVGGWSLVPCTVVRAEAGGAALASEGSRLFVEAL
jgi:hypothetical protein